MRKRRRSLLRTRDFEKGMKMGKVADFQSKKEELLSRVPPEFRPAIFAFAWEEGHANGESEVLIYIENFVDAIEGPIAALVARMSKTGKLK